MNTGGLAQMSHNDFTSTTGLGMPTGGLASRRGGQNIKPLSFDAIKSSGDVQDNGIPTPRTSRGHLLAGLRTAPKSATAATFANAGMSTPGYGRNNGTSENMYGASNMYNAPKTSLPRMATQQPAAYNMAGMSGMGHQHYTPEQILAPPEFHLDEQIQDQMDPGLYSQLVAANLYLAQQQQRLQQQLLSVQSAAQQFQGLNLNGQQALQQQLALQTLYQQQQQLQAMQQQAMQQTMKAQVSQNLFTYYDPNTRITYLVDPTTGHMQPSGYENQPSTPQSAYFQQPTQGTPRVQVSPPPAENPVPTQRTTSPPKRQEITAEPTPLPPPSANAFRRGHKKSLSSANINKGLSVACDEPASSNGPKTASLPLTPLTNGGYGPGQARAGEHPIRQPRGPPAMDELRAKPTAKHEGSKNFAARQRRSAVHNLMKAGLVRRKGTGSSCGSMSPVSESAEETGTPLTDNESDSGRSGSGSLSGDAEPSLASSQTSASGSWGAIGSDRPSSRQKSRRSVDSQASNGEGDNSFASVFKHGSQRHSKVDGQPGQRKAPRLVLTSAEKRKGGIPVA
ncbi:hypothetical protein RRF57_010080 [Xylaria bambusicola]|uniref:Uncharacterized protein n=1 Tax=Xylaria bambusicola TaxID=326684 RepID=A0AAN7UWQ0_9PEZI